MAATAPTENRNATEPADTLLLTVFLKHDPSKNLDDICSPVDDFRPVRERIRERVRNGGQ